jgi:chemotaxis response regulator CheB
MLESVARSYADRAVGVVLSGAGSDGALGSLALSQAGGFVLAQDKASCAFAQMPSAAIKVGAAGQVLSPAEMARALNRWAVSGAPPERADSDKQAGAAERIKVLLVDDHRVVLDGLRILLEGEPDMDVLAIAENGQTAVETALDVEPDVVVLDLRMPKLGGVEAARQILSRLPSTRVIALSSETNPRSIDQLFHAGAAGYLSKHCAFAELVRAIRAVVLGNAYMSPEVARLVAAGQVTAPLRGRDGAHAR